jgi:hypothetical protein
MEDEVESEGLSLICQIEYFQDGYVYPGDEQKIARLERQINEWERDVVNKALIKPGEMVPTRASMAGDLWREMNKGEGYWCLGHRCECERSHWVRQSAECFCWDCMHDPCACRLPLMWDEAQEAYYRMNSRTKDAPQRTWMSIPNTKPEIEKWRRDKKRFREYEDRMEEMRQCQEDQEEAQKEGYCCQRHAEKEKSARLEAKENKKSKTVNGPDHCYYCDEDPCAFIQIESDLCDNDDIYHVRTDYVSKANASACNGVRQERAFKYAAYILWNKRGYEGKHYECIERGVKSLFPVDQAVISGNIKKWAHNGRD